MIGEFDIPGLPVKFSAWPASAPSPAPLLGEHNAALLRELLSLSEAEIASLYAANVLVRDPLLDREPQS